MTNRDSDTPPTYPTVSFPENGVILPRRKRGRFGAIAFLTLVLAVHWSCTTGPMYLTRFHLPPCEDVCKMEVPYGSMTPFPVNQGQQHALRLMADMVTRCSQTQRFQVTWDQEGTSMGFSVRPHTLSYDRKTGIIQDITGEILFWQTGVKDSDIKAEADCFGTFATLQKRLQDAASPQEKRRENLGRQFKLAVRQGSFKTALSLLAQGADVDYLPAHILCASQYLDPPKEITDYANRNEDGYSSIETPLMGAIMRGNINETRFLLENGANAKQPGPTNTPLLVDAALTEHLTRETIAVLIQHGVNVNEVLENGNTPLIEAVERWDAHMTGILLQNGADTTIKNHEGKTALDEAKLAASMGHPELLRLFQNLKG